MNKYEILQTMKKKLALSPRAHDVVILTFKACTTFEYI